MTARLRDCVELCKEGNLLSEQGRHDEAETKYKEALKLSSEHPDALYGMGWVLIQRGRLSEARDYFKRLDLYDPKRAREWLTALGSEREEVESDGET